jgi:hypothetical protein
VSPAEVLSGSEVVPSMPLKRLVGAGVHRHANNRILHHGHHKHKSGKGTVPSGGSGHSHSGGDGGAKRHSKKHSKKGASRRAY